MKIMKNDFKNRESMAESWKVMKSLQFHDFMISWKSLIATSRAPRPAAPAEQTQPPPRSSYSDLTSPDAPIAPRVFNLAQDENGENEERDETSQVMALSTLPQSPDVPRSIVLLQPPPTEDLEPLPSASHTRLHAAASYPSILSSENQAKRGQDLSHEKTKLPQPVAPLSTKWTKMNKDQIYNAMRKHFMR